MYYELVQLGVVDKSQTRRNGGGADQNFADALTQLRERGVVPWSWLVDETRTLDVWRAAPTAAERSQCGRCRLVVLRPGDRAQHRRRADRRADHAGHRVLALRR